MVLIKMIRLVTPYIEFIKTFDYTIKVVTGRILASAMCWEFVGELSEENPDLKKSDYPIS